MPTSRSGTSQADPSDPRSILRELADQLTSGIDQKARIRAAAALKRLADGDDSINEALENFEFDVEPVGELPLRSKGLFVAVPTYVELQAPASLEDSLSQWRKPQKDDKEIVAAVESLVHERCENDEDLICPFSQYDELLRNRLREKGSLEKSMSLLEPGYFIDVTLAYVIVEIPENGRSIEALFHISRDSGKPKAVSFDHESPPLHELNAKSQLRLAGFELAYMALFMHVVRGPEGAFRIIDGTVWSALQTALDAEGVAQDERPHFFPLRVVGVPPAGGLHYESLILYSGAVFRALFSLNAKGMVEMEEDQPLLDVIDSMRDVRP